MYTVSNTDRVHPAFVLDPTQLILFHFLLLISQFLSILFQVLICLTCLAQLHIPLCRMDHDQHGCFLLQLNTSEHQHLPSGSGISCSGHSVYSLQDLAFLQVLLDYHFWHRILSGQKPEHYHRHLFLFQLAMPAARVSLVQPVFAFFETHADNL